MVYKKYVYKKGKKLGPYYYESYREGNTVKKKYIGGEAEYKAFLNLQKSGTTLSGRKILVLGSLFLIMLFSLSLIYFNHQLLTGKVTLDMKDSYSLGDKISGDLKLKIKAGELIPENSKIIVEQQGQIKDFSFSEVIKSNSNGSYYLEGKSISGQGEGYGFIGKKISYPYVYFTLILGEKNESIITPITENNETIIEINQTGNESSTEITQNETEVIALPEVENSSEQETSTETVETIPEQEVSVIETPVETTPLEETTVTETTTQESAPENTPSEESSESAPAITPSESVITETPTQTESSPITGNAISEEESEITGKTSANESFRYALGEKSAAIKEDSVYSDLENLSSSILNLETIDDELIVTTNYSKTEEGFGQEYLGEEHELDISLDELNLTAFNGTFIIRLVYLNETITEASKEISTTSNITPENITLSNVTLKIIQNISQIEIGKNSNYSLNLDEYFEGAEIYSINNTENITFHLSKEQLTTVPDNDFIGKRETEVTAYSGNESISQNFNILVSENLSNLSITTKSYKVILNRPVKWQKKVKLEGNETNITIALPKFAENISISNEGEALISETKTQEEIKNTLENKTSLITGQVSMEIETGNEGWLVNFWKNLMSSFTGRVTQTEVDGSTVTQTDESTIINVNVSEVQNNSLVVEYQTPGPIANEINLTDGKRIEISDVNEMNYTDILAYSELGNIVSINSTRLKLYWWTTYEEAVKYGYILPENLTNNLTEIISNETPESNITESIEQNLTTETNQTENQTITELNETIILEQNITENQTGNLTINNETISITGQIIRGITGLAIDNSNETEIESNTTSLNITLIRIEVPFWQYDLDEDGNTDYIEWIVPHLSNQTYDLIILPETILLDDNITMNGNYSHLTTSSEKLDPPYNSLVGYWNFDFSNSSNMRVYDLSRNNNDGNLLGSSYIGPGLYDDSLVLDGDGDYAKIPYSQDLNMSGKNLTVGLWVKPISTPSSARYFLTKTGTYYQFYTDTAGTVYFRIHNSTFSAQPSRSDFYSTYLNQWVFLTGTYNGTSAALYINGDYISSVPVTGNIADSAYSVEIGGYHQVGGDYGAINGSIDEVMVFNTTLNSSQISDIYNNQSARFRASGNVIAKQFNVTSGFDNVNVSFDDYERNYGSNISLKLGEWNQNLGYKDYDLGEHWAEFDGNGDYVNMGNFNLIANGTISLWANFNNLGLVVYPLIANGFDANLDANNQYYIDQYDNNLRWKIGNMTLTSGLNLELTKNTWYHIVMIKEGNNSSLYFDGVLNHFVSSGDFTNPSISKLNIGARQTGISSWDKFQNGSIDEVMIFNRSLSASEISDLYSKGRDIDYYDDSSLVSWWGFDNNFKDKKGTNDGIAYGDATINNSLGNGLVAYYHFDELGYSGTSGEVKDALGRNNGTAYASANTSFNSLYWKGLSLNGSSYVLVPASDSLEMANHNFAYSFWFRTNGSFTGTYPGIIMHGANDESSKGYLVNIGGTSNSGIVNFVIGNGTKRVQVSSTRAYNDNQWHFATAIFNRTGNLSVYIDNAKISNEISLSDYQMDLSTGGTTNIGCRGDSYLCFNGSLDEVMVFNRSLSPNEINELYIKGRAKWNYTAEQNLTDDNRQYYDIYTQSQGILSCWLDNLSDACSGRNNASLLNGAVWQNDNSKRNQSLVNHQSFGAMNVSDNDGSLDLSGPFSINAWIKQEQYRNYGGIVAKGENTSGSELNNNFYLRLSGDPKDIYFKVTNGTGNYQVATGCDNCIILNKWTMLSALYNGTNLLLYQDGILKGTSIGITAPLYADNQRLVIGTWASYWFNGTIDEVAIWNRSLSQEEIQNIYLKTKEKHSNDQISISRLTSNVLPVLKLISPNQFYTPLAIASSTSTTFAPLRLFTYTSWETDLPTFNFTYPTPENNSYSLNPEINLTIDELNLRNVSFNLNGTSSSLYDDSIVLLMNLNNNSAIGENSTYAVDSIGRNNGTIVNAVWNVSGKYGFGMKFDGDGDYVDFGSSTLFDSSNTTISLWFKSNSSQTNQRLIMSGASNLNKWGILIMSGAIAATNGSNQFVTVTSTVNNAWNHVVYDRANSKIYFNGVNISIPAIAADTVSYGANAIIGAKSSSQFFFNGSLDEVQIWNRSLSASEISQLYYSNLYKYNSTRWGLYLNESNLSTGNYNYSISAGDIFGSYNSISRTMNVDKSGPTINFISPINGTNQNSNSVIVNLSTSDNSGEHFSFTDEGLVSWYRMDDTNSSGDVVDFMGRNNGSKVGNATQVDNGKFGKAFGFDGNGDYVNLGNATLGTNHTILMWIKRNNNLSGQWYALAKFDAGYSYFTLHSSNYILFYGFNSTGQGTGCYGSTKILDTNWHLAAYTLTYNGSITTRRVYLDGVDDTSGTCYPLSGQVGFTGLKFIGNDLSNNYMNGSIDEVMVFNRSLSASEIKALYNSTANKYYNNFTNLADGNKTFNAYAVDSFGNVAMNSSTVAIKTTSPSISIYAPLNDSNFNNQSVLFNVSSSEERTGFIVPNLDNSLVSWYRMDDTNSSGDVLDYLGRNNGTKFGNASQIQNGKFGKAESFDGVTGSAIQIGKDNDNPLINNGSNFTISLWFNAKNVTKSQGLYGYYNSGSANNFAYGLWFSGTSGYVIGFVGNGTAYSSLVSFLASTETWDNVILTFNGTRLTSYKNGILWNSKDVTSEITGVYPQKSNIGTRREFIGATYALGSGNFNGSIDELMIFNRSLTQQEIYALYNATKLQYTQTGIADGSHTYSAYTSDVYGNIVTASNSFNVNTGVPAINFTTTINNSNVSSSFLLNATVTDSSDSFGFNDEGLVSWYRMDDTNSSGGLVDFIGRNNGTKFGNATQVTNGKFGKGMGFDGVDDYIRVNDNNDLDLNGTNYTLSLWVKKQSLSSTHDLIYKGGGGSAKGYYLRVIYGTGLDAKLNNGTSSIYLAKNSIPEFSDNNWTLITLTYNGTGLVLYINGVINTFQSGTVTGDVSSIANAWIGSEVGTYFFNGSIDEVMIFNRSLSSSEISALYNSSQYNVQRQLSNISEGTVNYRVYASDTAGNVNSSILTVNVDNTAPLVSINSPINTNYNNQTLNVNITANDSRLGFIVPNLDNSLVSWWRMDDTNSSGDVVDFMGRNNESKKGNASQIQNGKFGKGFGFDGVNSYVDLGTSGNLYNNFSQMTISLWLKTVNLNNINRLFLLRGDNSEYNQIGITTSGTLFLHTNIDGVQHNNDIYSASGNIQVYTWYNLIFVYNGTNWNYYKNGNFTNRGSTYSGSIKTQGTNQLGSIGGTTDLNQGLNGSIDEVMIFNRSLTQQEISALYNATAPKYDYNFGSDGNHSIIAYGVDQVGNVNSTSVSFNINTALPSISVNYPQNNSYVNSVVLVNASVNTSQNQNSFGFVNRGLVSWWRMDDTNSSGDVIDYLGRNNGSKVGNAAQVSNGKFGEAMNFDGTGDYVNVLDNSNLRPANSITVSAWINVKDYPTSAGRVSEVVRKNLSPAPYLSYELYVLNVSNSLYPVFTIGNATLNNPISQSPTSLSFNNWYHLVGIYNGTTSAIYVNGILKDSDLRSGDITYDSTPLSIGAGNAGGNPFNGSIDEVMIFNRSLSADEIKALYNTSANRILYNLSELSEGVNNVNLKAVDESGNVGEKNILLNYKTSKPTLNFVEPSPLKGISQGNLNLNVSVSDSQNQSFAMFSDGLVSWYRMDDTNSSGDVLDYLGRNNGTRINATQIQNGKFGKGMNFDGVNSYVNLNSNFIRNQFAGTICLWFNDLDIQNNQVAFMTSDLSLSDDGFWISTNYASNSGRIAAIMRDSSSGYSGGWVWIAYYNAAYSANQWHHFCVAHNSTAPILYYDGNSVTYLKTSWNNQSLWLNTFSSQNMSNFIGKFDRSSGPGSYFNGSIDEVMIFNRSLSASEIQALYNSSQYSLTRNLNNLEEGSYNYLAYASDLAGNINSSNLSFIVDNTAPSLSFTSPINGTNQNSNSVIVNLSTSDNNLNHFSFVDEGLVSWWRMDDAQSNLINNSGFENGMDNWGKSDFSSRTLTNITSDGCYRGNYCLNVSGLFGSGYDTAWYARTSVSSVVAGASYNLSYWSRHNQAISGYLGSSFYRNVIIWRNTNGDYIQNDTFNFSSANENWHLENYIFTAPTGAVSAVINFGFDSPNMVIGNYVLLDEVRFEQIDGQKNYLIDKIGSNDGNLMGNASQISNGKFGKAMAFDGNGDYVNTNADLSWNNTNDFSISIWFNTRNVNQSQVLLGKSNWEYALKIDNSTGNNQLRFGYWNTIGLDELSLFASINPNIWYNAIITYNDSVGTLYLNGIDTSTDTTISSQFEDRSLPLWIGYGYYSSGQSHYFNGSIDEVMIFNRSLSASEIAALYNSTANKYYNNFTNLADGNKTFNAYAVDLAGNVAMNSSTVGIKTTSPSVTINSPLNQSNLNNQSVLFNVSSSEEGTGFIVPNLDNSLVSWYRMDDYDGTHVLDYFGRYNLTKDVSSTVVQQDNGKFGKALYSSQDAHNIVDDSSVPIMGDVNSSGFIWYKPVETSESVDQQIFNKKGTNSGIRVIESGTNIKLFVYSSGYKCLGGPLEVTNVLTNNQWTQIGYTGIANYSGSYMNLSLYIDGTLRGTRLCNITLTNGLFLGVTIYPLNGSIDEFMLWNRSLTSQEILGLYNATKLQYASNLSEGSHTYSAYTSDIAGNIQTSSVNNFNVDLTSPVISVPENYTLTNTQNVLVNASVSDDKDTFGFVNDGLVSWWRMDDTNSTGDLVDYLGRNNGSKFGNAAQIQNGKFGKAMNFDGDGDYVDTGLDYSNTLSESESFDFSFWFKPSESAFLSSWNRLFVERNSIILNIQYDHISLYLYNGTGYAHGIVSDSFDTNWHHGFLKINYSGGVINSTFYLDSNYNGSFSKIGSLPINTNTLLIGYDYTGGFNGSLDEVMIFNRSLSADEIKALYNSSANRIQTRLNNLGEGNNNYTIYSSDVAGNIATQSLAVELETQKPDVEILSPANNSVVSLSPNIVINSSDLGKGNKNISTFVDLDNSLVSWYRMDDGNSTNLFDYTGKNNGTLFGDTKQIDNGKFGKGMEFDGDGDYVKSKYFLNFYGSNVSTTSVWFKPTLGNTGIRRIAQFGRYYVQDDSVMLLTWSNVPQCGGTYNSINHWFPEGSAVSVNEWHNLICVYNGTNIIGYVDGIYQNSNALALNMSPGYLYLSSHNFEPQSFNGSLDEVMIFNRSLSAEEIAGLYGNQSTRYLNVSYQNLELGQHNVKVYSQDLSGNVNVTDTRIFTTSPVVCGDVITSDKTMTTDLYCPGQTALIIGADNVVLDCAGHIISSNNISVTNGIYASGKSNITLKNCIVKDFDEAIKLDHVTNSYLENNTGISLYDGDGIGIYLYSSNNNTLVNNLGISNNSYGIYMGYSSNNTLTSNLGTSSFQGIHLDSSSNYNTLEGNIGNCTGSYSSGRCGIRIESSQYNNLINNIGDSTNNFGIYLSSSSNNTLTSNTGTSNLYPGLVLSSSSNNTLTSNTGTSNTSYGIGLSSSSNYNSLINNTGTSNSYVGIYLSSSSNYNTLINNTGTSNSYVGIGLSSSSNYNSLINNIAKSETRRGIQIEKSDYNLISGINASVTDGTDQAIFVYNSSMNNFTDCVYVNAGTDVRVESNDARETMNYFANCSYSTEQVIGSQNNLVREMYLSVNVTRASTGAILDNAFVRVRNQTGQTFINGTTNENGTYNFGLIEKYRNNGSIVYSSYDTQVSKSPFTTAVTRISSDANEYQNIALQYAGYSVDTTQTLADIYTNVGSDTDFANLSTSEKCRYASRIDINVTSGGELIIENCTLEMNSSLIGGTRTLSISGGSLTVNNSNISSSDQSYYYRFYSLENSNLTMKNSLINYAGTDNSTYYSGFEIGSKNLIFQNITMSKNRRALTLWQDNLTILNSRISGSNSLSFGDNIRIVGDNIKIVGCNLSNPTIGRADILIDANKKAIVLDSNYTRVGFQEGASLTRQWSYTVCTSPAVSGVAILAYNLSTSQSLFDAGITGTSGCLKFNLTSYIQNSSGNKDYYNYSIYAAKSGYYEASLSLTNVSEIGSVSIPLTVIPTPTPAAPSAGGGGGGGTIGGNVSIVQDLRLDLQDINLDLVINSNKERIVKVTNNGNKEEEISLSSEGLGNVVVFPVSSFKLNPGESREVSIVFIARNETGTYSGKILIGGNELLVSVNLRSKELLFDAGIVVPDSDKLIKLGSKLSSQVTLIPMGENPRVDVTLNYFIKDFDGKTYLTESETILVESQKTFKKEFYTSNLPVGKYVLSLELVYPNGVATSSSHFEIAKTVPYNSRTLFFVILAGAVILLIFIVIFMLRYKKYKRTMNIKGKK